MINFWWSTTYSPLLMVNCQQIYKQPRMDHLDLYGLDVDNPSLMVLSWWSNVERSGLSMVGLCLTIATVNVGGKKDTWRLLRPFSIISPPSWRTRVINLIQYQSKSLKFYQQTPIDNGFDIQACKWHQVKMQFRRCWGAKIIKIVFFNPADI